MRKGLQGLTGGAEGLLHQAHLHHLRGETGETSPASTTRCPSAPSPSHSPPRRAQTSGRSPRRGCARKKSWSGAGQLRGSGTLALSRGQRELAPGRRAPLLCPPSPGPPCPRRGSAGHTTQGGKESAPAVPGEGLHAGRAALPRSGGRGSSALARGTGRDRDGRTRGGEGGKEGGPGSGTASTSQYLI